MPPDPEVGLVDPGAAERVRSTQADRRARSRTALLESAAQHLSRYGYGNLVLEQVARDAGYTRGALYHQFKDKSDLTLAVFEWVLQLWAEEVGAEVERQPDPVVALLTLAHRHAVFCRRDIARIAVALRLEFAGQESPVGQQVEQAYERLVTLCTALIAAGREAGTIASGPPVRVLALGFVGAIEGTVIALTGQPPDDTVLTVRAAAGVLGVDPATVPEPRTQESSP